MQRRNILGALLAALTVPLTAAFGKNPWLPDPPPVAPPVPPLNWAEIPPVDAANKEYWKKAYAELDVDQTRAIFERFFQEHLDIKTQLKGLMEEHELARAYGQLCTQQFIRHIMNPVTGQLYDLGVIWHRDPCMERHLDVRWENFEFTATCSRSGWRGVWPIVDVPLRVGSCHNRRVWQHEFNDWGITNPCPVLLDVQKTPEQAAALQLMMGRQLSQQMGLKSIGYDWDREQKQLQTEMETQERMRIQVEQASQAQLASKHSQPVVRPINGGCHPMYPPLNGSVELVAGDGVRMFPSPDGGYVSLEMLAADNLKIREESYLARDQANLARLQKQHG